MNRTIITVIGKDRVGIIAAVCTYLAEHKINILDIDQSIIQGYFHMMMIVDANGADKEYASLVKDLEKNRGRPRCTNQDAARRDF